MTVSFNRRVEPDQSTAGSGANEIVRRNSNALLLVVCLGQFMVILDVSIVNVALPSIKDALGFSTTGLQWVLNAYTLTFAGFLLLGGRASDLFGRRRTFFTGTLIFSGASLLCAAGPVGRLPARGPGAAGNRRGDPLAGDARDHRHLVRRGPAA